MRAVVNAMLYQQRCGCPWRMLPHDFPHWRTVYGYSRLWQQDGTWDAFLVALRRARREARQQGKAAQPRKAA
jgi:putative transposase